MIGETVTRLRSTTTTDRYGNTSSDWTTPDRLDIEGVTLAPRLQGEDSDRRQGVVIGWTLYAPHGADIQPTDRIEARGKTLEVDGEPGDWVSPHTGRGAGLELALKTVEG